MKNLVVLYFFYTFTLSLVETIYKRYILLFFIFPPQKYGKFFNNLYF